MAGNGEIAGYACTRNRSMSLADGACREENKFVAEACSDRDGDRSRLFGIIWLPANKPFRIWLSMWFIDAKRPQLPTTSTL